MKFSVFVIASLSFAGSVIAGPPITITAADAGHPIKLRVGEELVLELECNPSTGYGWFLTETPNSILLSRGAPTYQPSRSMPGAGGLESWNFRAAKAGVQALELEYRRPWEKNTSPAKTVVFNVTVAPRV